MISKCLIIGLEIRSIACILYDKVTQLLIDKLLFEHYLHKGRLNTYRDAHNPREVFLKYLNNFHLSANNTSLQFEKHWVTSVTQMLNIRGEK